MPVPPRTLTVVQQVRVTTYIITTMKLHWKLIAIELILEIVLELAPASLNLMATIAQYLAELSLEARKDSVQLIVASVGHHNANRGPIIDVAR